MNKLLIAVIISMLSINTFSQEIKFFNQRPDRNLTLGIGGDGGVISIHHEKLNIISYNLILATELGLGATQDVSITNPNHYYLSIPFNISACFGKRMHLFEAGLGSTIHLRINDPFYEFCIYPILGYRLQPVKSRKVMFKIYASIPYNLNYQTYINLKDSEVFFIPLGISIGKSF